MSEFQIRKDNFAVNRIVENTEPNPASALAVGEILVKIDRFAITANNITYAVLGDRLGYWQFFPTAAADAGEWGILPVWGFADVVFSNAQGVAVGERLFGYFPPAKYLKLLPVRTTPTRLFDGAVHRAALPPGYNSYTRVLAEPGYDRKMDDVRMLLWPLHMTSFCLGDLLQDKKYFDAKQIVILSASSKTSIGLAYALQADAAAPPMVAVTSARNSDFVSQLGIYQQTVTYDAMQTIDASIPTVIVDMSGNGELLAKLRAHLGDNMKRCINVGLTHWDETKLAEASNAERSEFFFAPGHIQMRMKDWGMEEFTLRTSKFLRESAIKSIALLTFKKLDGLSGLAEVYADVCAGKIPPDQGLIVEM
jgi:Protein of unknown function (DUF2855)